jgi:hypothetical protein
VPRHPIIPAPLLTAQVPSASQNIRCQVVLEILLLSPSFALPAVLHLKRRGSRAKHKLPFYELRRRPPGEFLRVKVDLIGLPAILGAVAGIFRGEHKPSVPILFTICIVWTVGSAWRLGRLS